MGIFDFFVIAVLVLLTFAIAYPIYYTIIASFSDHQAVATGQVNLVPVGFQLTAYQAVFENDQIWQGYLNTIIYTVVGTVLNVAVTVAGGYALSRPTLPGRGIAWAWRTYMVFSHYHVFQRRNDPNVFALQGLEPDQQSLDYDYLRRTEHL